MDNVDFNAKTTTELGEVSIGELWKARAEQEEEELRYADERVRELEEFLSRLDNYDELCGTFNSAPETEEINAMAIGCRATISASKESP